MYNLLQAFTITITPSFLIPENQYLQKVSFPTQPPTFPLPSTMGQPHILSKYLYSGNRTLLSVMSENNAYS